MSNKQKAAKTVFEEPEDFYRVTLQAAGLTVSDDGAVSRPVSATESTPVEVGDKLLYLPTRPLRAKNKWDAIQPFHPLCEDILCGQSIVYKMLLRYLPAHLSAKLIETFDTLVKVGCSVALQKENSNPAADSILTECALGIKTSVEKRWTALKKKMVHTPLVKMYVSRDIKTLDGEYFSRVATISFPFLDDIDSKDNKISDVDMLSKANKQAIVKIFDYVLKDIPLEFGSSAIVPYYHVYLTILRAFTKRLNEINNAFARVSHWEPIDESWFEVIDNLDPLVGRIPKLSGNAGVPVKDHAKKVKNSIAAAQFDKVNIPAGLTVDEDDLKTICETPKVEVTRERPYSKAPVPQRAVTEQAPQYSPQYGPQPVSVLDIDSRDPRDDRYNRYRDDRYDRYAEDRYRRQDDRYDNRQDDRYGNRRPRYQADYNNNYRRSPIDDLDYSRRDSRSRRNDDRGRGYDDRGYGRRSSVLDI